MSLGVGVVLVIRSPCFPCHSVNRVTRKPLTCTWRGILGGIDNLTPSIKVETFFVNKVTRGKGILPYDIEISYE